MAEAYGTSIGGGQAYSIQQTRDGGFVVTGYTSSLDPGGEDVWVLKLDGNGDIPGCSARGVSYATVQGTNATIYVTNVTGVASIALVQSPIVSPYDTTATETRPCYYYGPQLWAKTYGGSTNDYASSIQQTQDGGFVAAGSTGAYPRTDAWVSKLDSYGNVIWQKTYSQNNNDAAVCIQQTSDGGYIVLGNTLGGGGLTRNLWLMKLYGDGSIAWQKAYGAGSYNDAESIQQTSDGGYIVAGRTYFVLGGSDAWILKLDTSGNVRWQKAYGGVLDDWARSVQQTSDGGYIVAGNTASFGAGRWDAWVLKLDSDGTIVWQKAYGADSHDYAVSVQQTSDGGYIMAGGTASFGAGLGDAWVLKLRSDGTIVWQKSYGGTMGDVISSIQQTSDGGYIAAGPTDSFPPSGAVYVGDAWVLKLDSNGNIVWQKAYGGTTSDYGYTPQRTSDGGYILAGYSASFGVGGADAWVLKIDSNGDIPGCSAVWIINAIVQNTSATTLDTKITGVNTSVSPQISGLVPTDAHLGDTLICRADLPRHRLTITKSGDGSGMVTSIPAGINCGSSCSSTFTAGMRVMLTATPAPGSIFTGWSGGCSGTLPCTVTMTGDIAVTANFDDGIETSIDTQPSVFSNDFKHGTTYGTIEDRGSQLLLVTDDPASDGVRIKADPSGGLSPARVSACVGSAIFSLSLGDEMVVTCGSVGVKVLQGTVEITFIATNGTPATTSLNGGNSLLFEPTTFTLTAPRENSETVIVIVDGKQFSIPPGQTVVLLTVMVISIDIKPGSYPNSINPKSKGNIPVAILSTASFNAPARVDRNSLTFGRTGNEKSLAFCNPSAEDVNKDGLGDLICHFDTQSTGFQVGDTKGVLKGRTKEGLPIEGSDSVKIVP